MRYRDQVTHLKNDDIFDFAASGAFSPIDITFGFAGMDWQATSMMLRTGFAIFIMLVLSSAFTFIFIGATKLRSDRHIRHGRAWHQ